MGFIHAKACTCLSVRPDLKQERKRCSCSMAHLIYLNFYFKKKFWLGKFWDRIIFFSLSTGVSQTFCLLSWALMCWNGQYLYLWALLGSRWAGQGWRALGGAGHGLKQKWEHSRAFWGETQVQQVTSTAALAACWAWAVSSLWLQPKGLASIFKVFESPERFSAPCC